jgi:hypothetical protein
LPCFLPPNWSNPNTGFGSDLGGQVNVLFTLPDDVIFSIIGYIPDPGNFEMIDFYSLREVIGYILQNHKPLSAEAPLVVPGFDEKIEFNGLSKRVKSL